MLMRICSSVDNFCVFSTIFVGVGILRCIGFGVFATICAHYLGTAMRIGLRVEYFYIFAAIFVGRANRWRRLRKFRLDQAVVVIPVMVVVVIIMVVKIVVVIMMIVMMVIIVMVAPVDQSLIRYTLAS